MDALSLAANVISVVNATKAAVANLKRLQESLSAPPQVTQLLSETIDTEAILLTVQGIVLEIGQQPFDPVFYTYLGSLTERAMDQVTQIFHLADSGWIQNLNAADEKSAKRAWKRWLKSKDLQRLSTALRSIRQDIAASLTVLTASEVPRVRTTLRAIVLRNEETAMVLEKTKGEMNSRLDSLRRHLSSISLDIADTQKTLHLESSPDGSASPSRELLPYNSDLRRDLADSLCNGLCLCNCHKSQTLNSPKWAKNVVGVILLSWSGVLGHPICNQKRCQRSQNRMLKLGYYFPTWFISRVIYLQHKFVAMDDHEILLRTPRIVPHSDHMFYTAVRGDIAEMQRLFSEGLASPFVVNPEGNSLLAYSITVQEKLTMKRVNMFKFLLQQSADPWQEDQQFRSPMTRAWNLILTKPTDSVVQALKAVVYHYLDPIEDLKNYLFTPIHLTVLGLSPINLGQQLQVSTAQLDVGCSAGKTPLIWAVQRGDMDMIKTLLNFGARLDRRDKRGSNVFYFAVENPDVKILQVLLSAAYSQSPCCAQSLNSSTSTTPKTNPTSVNFVPCCQHENLSVKTLLDCGDHGFGHTPLLRCSIRNHLSHARLLLAHGATTEAATGKFENRAEAPLLHAVAHNSYGVLKLLLAAGTKTDVRDDDDMAILHIAAVQGDVNTIRILGEENICCLSISDRDAYGRTPLEAFDIMRPDFRSEEDVEIRRCRRAFVKLLKSVKPPDSDHTCTIRGPPDLSLNANDATEVCEVGRIASIHSNEKDSDDDEFFEAHSTFEEVEVQQLNRYDEAQV